MRAKRAGECDGPAGLPEAARGGPGPTPWSPARVVHPGARHPCGSSPTRDRKGVAAGRPSLHRPRRGGRPTGPGRLPPVRPGPASTPGRRRAREKARRPSPWPGAGSPLHHQRRPSRPATEPRGPPRGAATISSDEAAAELLRPAGLQHPRGRRAAQRAKDEEHARPLAQGQRVDSSTGRVTTNRSTPPAHPARLAAAHPDRINPHL